MKKRKKTLKIIFIVILIPIVLLLDVYVLGVWVGPLLVDNYNIFWNSGYVDKTGKEVIPLKYVRVGYFHEGLASVSNKRNLFGVIDKKGKVVIPFKYYYISDFKDGFAVAAKKRGYKGFYNSCVKYNSYIEALLKEKNPTNVEIDYAMGVIDKTGKEISPFKYDYIIPSDYGISLAINFDENKDKRVYLDRTGKRVFKSYDYINQFFNEYAAVGYNYKQSVDKNGNLKLTRVYNSNNNTSINGYNNGAIAPGENYSSNMITNSYIDTYYTLIDTNGKEMLPFEYTRIIDVYKGLAYVRKRVVKSQKEIDKYKGMYSRYSVDLKNGFYLVDVTGFIDIKTNKEIVPCEFDETLSGSCGDYPYDLPIILDKKRNIDHSVTEKLVKDGCLVMKKGREAFIVKKTGEIIPLNYYGVGWYSEGLISAGRIEKDSKYKYYTDMGNCKVFDNYEAALKYINNDKNKVLNIIPTKVKYGYVDSDGKEVIPFIYDEANGFENGEAYVRQGNRNFYIDKTEKFLRNDARVDCSSQDKKTGKYALMGDHRDSLVPVAKFTLLGKLVDKVFGGF